MKTAVGVVSVVALVGAGLGTAYGFGYLTQPPAGFQSQMVTGPTDWVSFSALSTHLGEGGQVRLGRFYQGADGSTRSESGSRREDVSIIGIKNIGEGVFYLWKRKTGWESHPMDMPPSGWKPRSGRPIGFSTIMFADIEGFDVIKDPIDRYGTTTYYAPELNFFPVRIVTRCRVELASECGVRLSEITIGEQPSEYFKPPPGVPVLERSEPGGIVRLSRPSAGGKPPVCRIAATMP
jgi:hypothetical protein